MTKTRKEIQKDTKTNSTKTSTHVIVTQQFLKQHGFAGLPSEFVEFLHNSNGIISDGGVICGIHSNKNNTDISTLNILIFHPLHKDMVFLGYDDFDYLAYNQKHKVYQIIDKDDLEVLEEYTDFTSAARHILKTNDD